jgi:ribA/ribD-fused uncharacterized protein
VITEFQGEYRFLSNFWPALVVLDGVEYPTVEHAYQAAKTFPEWRFRFRRGTAGQAKRASRDVPLRLDWNEIRVDVMRGLLEQKFAAGTALASQLLQTSGELQEGNTWGDTFWGVCHSRGENTLGKLLMEIRENLLAARWPPAEEAADSWIT